MIRRVAVPLALLLAACGNGGSPEPPERIVLIVVDTLRRDHVGVYGADRPTPNMDRLAEAGTVFRRAVSSFHSTPTSMAALFTGRTPSLESEGGRALPFGRHSWCGMSRFASDADARCLPPGVPTLAERMRGLGHRTMAVHSHPLLGRDDGFARGFDDWVRVETESPEHPDYVESRSGSHVTEAAIEAVDGRASDRFFLWVHYLDAHDWHWRRDGSYAEGVARADAAVGALLDALEERELLEDGVVVLTSDHGESLGERHFRPPRPRHAGNPSFEPVLRVPVIVGGRRLEDPERFLRGEDVFRLLVRLAGGEVEPSGLERGELLLTERRFRTYRSGRWKSFWPRDGGPARLVDLQEDPGELRDVAAQQPQVVAAHRARVTALARSLATHRPVREGLDPEAKGRLRALGYLEPAYDLDTPVEELPGRPGPDGGD